MESLEALLSNSVCIADAQWQPELPRQPEQRGDPDRVSNADRRAHARDGASLSEAEPAKKHRTDAADTAPSSVNTNTFWARVERAGDIMELRRLGPDLYEFYIRLGVHWIGDAQVRETLPQG